MALPGAGQNLMLSSAPASDSALITPARYLSVGFFLGGGELRAHHARTVLVLPCRHLQG